MWREKRGAVWLCRFRPAGVIPDESKALSLLAPANAVAGLLPGGGLLPTPNPLTSVSVNRSALAVFTYKDLNLTYAQNLNIV